MRRRRNGVREPCLSIGDKIDGDCRTRRYSAGDLDIECDLTVCAAASGCVGYAVHRNDGDARRRKPHGVKGSARIETEHRFDDAGKLLRQVQGAGPGAEALSGLAI